MKKLIEVKNLSKSFLLQRRLYTALFDLNFAIFENEILGLVGESGCGKSLLSKVLLGLEKKDEGEILYRGEQQTYSKELKKKCQMIFQDPFASLNPKMSVCQIIAEPFEIHKIAFGREKEIRIENLLKNVGLDPEMKKLYPHELSGGQRQRVGIARALAVEPKFLICDEPISALDVSTAAQIVNLLKNLRDEKGLTYLFIAHDLSMVKYISDRILVMYLGHIVESGPSEEVCKDSLHPYTQALFSSIPIPDPDIERKRAKIIISGEVPSIFNPPKGCPFHQRCPKVMKICKEKMPKLQKIGTNRSVACHLFADN